ncbi:putative two-component response regulator protein [Ochrobactrum sp. CDB2]|nr:putative two-component response regulator protein [Ochrobactrum sp. CDB2]
MQIAINHGQLSVMVQSKRCSPHLYRGKKLLIFEESFLLSEEAKTKLMALGASILGPVDSAKGILAYLASETVDAVILDVTIEPEIVLPVISALETHHIPFIFALSSHPGLNWQRFAGFVLSAADDDLATIATALFGQPSLMH